MSARLRLLLPLLVAAIVAPSLVVRESAAQVPLTVEVSDTIWEIELADGSTVIGRVTVATETELTVVTVGGATVQLQRAQVRRMAARRGAVREDEVWSRDPNRTRLFFGPTGRMLDQDEGYVSVFELFFPFVSYGLTDNITVAGGSPILPGAIGRVWYFAPKVGIDVGESTAVSAGVLAFFETDDDISEDFESLGMLYAAASHGGENSAITAGVGFGFAGEDVSSRPAFLLGAEHRVSERVKLLTENYFFAYRRSAGTAIGFVLTGGVRFIGGRLSADAGIALGGDADDTSCCLPLVNFVYNFGGRR